MWLAFMGSFAVRHVAYWITTTYSTVFFHLYANKFVTHHNMRDADMVNMIHLSFTGLVGKR